MNGIYLTQKVKQELEAKIANIKKPAPHWDGIYVSEVQEARADLYEEILSEAIVLPIEESWDVVELYPPDNESQIKHTLKYKNGVIITRK